MRIKLAYYSGTGGTERIALCFAEEFVRRNHDVDIKRIRRATDEPVSLAGFDLLVVVSVVHDFNIPHQMMLWLESLAITPGLRIAFLSVSGGGAALSNRAVRRNAIKLLEAKGADVFFEDMLSMPSNYLYQIRRPVDAMEMEAFPLIVRKRTSQILAGDNRRFKEPLIDRLITWSCRNAWQRGAAFGRAIIVSDACIGCGTCVTGCPSGNISLAPVDRDGNADLTPVDGDSDSEIASDASAAVEQRPALRPVFSDKCAVCLNCFYVCPQAALRPGREKSAILKAGFDLDEIANRKATDAEWQTLESFTGGWLYSGIKPYLIEARELRSQADSL